MKPKSESYILSDGSHAVQHEIAASSIMNIYYVDSFNETASSDHTITFVVHENASLTVTIVLMHHKQSKIHIKFAIQGKHAQVRVAIIYALSKMQALEIITEQMHESPFSESTILVKGIIRDQTLVSYKGMINVRESAMRTNADLQHKNIIFGEQARVISQPMLEVLQHDVQCSHGTALGTFSKKALWLLASVGCTRKQAEQLLIRSWYAEIVSEDCLEYICQKMSHI